MHTVDLTGKRALVTGSSRGLGRHYALHLARAGADVIVHDVNERAAAEFGEAPSGPAVAEQIRALGRRSAFFGADLTDPAQAEYLVQQVLTTLGHLDILVNNAGGDIGCRTPRPDPNDALEIDPDDIRCVLERNLLTTMYTCKYAGLYMRERRAGKIINVGSTAGHLPVHTGIIYAAAKRAERGKLLTEMQQVTGLHRKSLTRLMHAASLERKKRVKQRARTYGLATEQGGS